MIKRLKIHNFKCIKKADIEFNDKKNVIVGNNGVGKSTIMEALLLAMGYGLNKLEITPYLFHIDSICEFLATKMLPEITIEVLFSGDMDEFSGTNNSLQEPIRGLRLKICFDDSYSDLFESEKATCTQIPCEYYKVERYWFSDQPVKQQLMPYNVLLVDSSSTYFNTSSNQYMANVIKLHIGSDETVKVKSSLRQLREKFEEDDKIEPINKKLSKEIDGLKVSIDMTSDNIFKNILCPFFKNIPIKQIGEGEKCILKTLLSIDKFHQSDKPRIIIIEEPETHLSHSKMYELIMKIENNIDKTSTQLIITTHNSFIANKLDLSNLIMIENDNGEVKPQKFSTGAKDLYSYFAKISNYPTLRLILCKSAILVEGPTDEIIVTCYYYKRFNKHPFDDGIELISVGGTDFKQFAELVKGFNKKIAIITDNDGKNEKDLLKTRGLQELPNSIRVFTEDNVSLITLEHSFVAANEINIQKLSDTIMKKRGESVTKDELLKYMINNKAEWAYRLMVGINAIEFSVPKYIENAVNWLTNGK